MSQQLSIASIQTHVFRSPITVPVKNLIGTMRNRPMLIVQIEDSEGGQGWGEVWCNFPSVGAEHRANLIKSVFEPLLAGEALATPTSHFERLTQITRRQVIQAGEPGPFAQCIAGIDQALTDLAARRNGEPLWRFLGGKSSTFNAYASALGPEGSGESARDGWDQGFRSFKLKVGFGRERDINNLTELRAAIPTDARIMVDANQAWSPSQAIDMIDAIAPFYLTWVEEPISAEATLSDWQAVANRSPIPIAAGENLRGEKPFSEAIRSGAFGFIQPDIGKWGGFTGGLEVGRSAVAAGVAFCPHWLGGGLGLLASMHLLAAVGGKGLAEVDANPNLLRQSVQLPPLLDGCYTLSDAPGLGLDPASALIPLLSEFRVR